MLRPSAVSSVTKKWSYRAHAWERSSSCRTWPPPDAARQILSGLAEEGIHRFQLELGTACTGSGLRTVTAKTQRLQRLALTLGAIEPYAPDARLREGFVMRLKTVA